MTEESMTSKVTRKQFLQTSLCLIGGSAVVIGGLGCSDDDDDEAPSVPGGAGGTGGTSGGTSGRGGTGGAAGTGGTSGAAGTGGTSGTGGAAGTGGSAGGGSVTSCNTNVSTSDGHTHTLMVPAADAVAGVDKTYTTGITEGHTHMVTVTAADFQILRSGQSVMKPTTLVDEHLHQVTVMCM
jgi:hypothetical protein